VAVASEADLNQKACQKVKGGSFQRKSGSFAETIEEKKSSYCSWLAALKHKTHYFIVS